MRTFATPSGKSLLSDGKQLARSSKHGPRPSSEGGSSLALVVVSVAAIVVVIAIGLAGGESGRDPAVDTQPTAVTDEDGLTRGQACAEFFAITSDLTLTDAGLAAAYRELARDTDDPSLAAEIRGIGDAFARGDAEISSSGVLAICS